MQVFHHPTIIGGSWTNLSKTSVAIIGFDHDAKPVEIIKKSVKDTKGKSHSLYELTLGSECVSDFEKLCNPKIELSIKNIIPIPVLLIQVFMGSSSTEPIPVALAYESYVRIRFQAQRHPHH